MRDIAELAVTQFRMFPVDMIPFSALKVESAVKAIKERFGFTRAAEALGFASTGESLDLSTATPVLSFIAGEAKVGKKKVVIDKIDIDPRKIVLQVRGTSSEANNIYNHLGRVIAQAAAASRLKLDKPIVLFEETRCVVTLDFEFARFFTASLLTFLGNEIQTKASSSLATATVAVKNFSAVVDYRVTDESALAQKVNLVAKNITVEPRAGTDPKSRRYYTSSPFDSDTHLEILRRLAIQFKE